MTNTTFPDSDDSKGKQTSKKRKEENNENLGHDLIIVGIGASAGGLAALEEFFMNMPPDSGLAFVVIQHLDPAHESMLPHILQRSTNMKVIQIENKMKAKRNTIFVIPPGYNISLAENHLYLNKQKAPRGVPLPVDYFFRSLKDWNHEKAIGIILSGTGSDGTMGIKEIKAENGMVMVQDPVSANYKKMPETAIETGLVDYILKPAEMPEKLIDFVKNTLNITGKEKKFEFQKSEPDLNKLYELLKRYTKHDFSEYKNTTFLRRIERRMSINSVRSIDEYIHLLQENQREPDLLFKELLIGVTSFFRDQKAFKFLEKNVIPEIMHSKTNEPFRVWVAGCSTGEEAYSIAILIDKYLHEHKKNNLVFINIYDD